MGRHDVRACSRRTPAAHGIAWANHSVRSNWPRLPRKRSFDSCLAVEETAKDFFYTPTVQIPSDINAIER